MIKKLLLLTVLFLGVFTFVKGQTPIPNASFENWTTHSGLTSYQTPDGWQTLNQLTSLAGQFTAKRDTHHYAGSYSIRLQGIAGIPFIGTVPGMLSTGVINQTNFSATGGFPVNFRPYELKGYYQYDLSAGLDTATIVILLSKWNTTTNSRDTVGLGGTQFRTNVSTWTSFTAFILPVPFTSTVIPDTCSIIILSGSLTSATPGALYLDDLSFFPANSGIGEVSTGNNHLFVYPNPAATSLTVKYEDYATIKASMVLTDVSGRIVSNEHLTQQITTISTTGLADGIYFYRLLDGNQTPLATGKISIINK